MFAALRAEKPRNHVSDSITQNVLGNPDFHLDDRFDYSKTRNLVQAKLPKTFWVTLKIPLLEAIASVLLDANWKEKPRNHVSDSITQNVLGNPDFHLDDRFDCSKTRNLSQAELPKTFWVTLKIPLLEAIASVFLGAAWNKAKSSIHPF